MSGLLFDKSKSEVVYEDFACMFRPKAPEEVPVPVLKHQNQCSVDTIQALVSPNMLLQQKERTSSQRFTSGYFPRVDDSNVQSPELAVQRVFCEPLRRKVGTEESIHKQQSGLDPHLNRFFLEHIDTTSSQPLL